MTPMTKLFAPWVMLVAFTGAAFAQSGATADPAGSAAAVPAANAPPTSPTASPTAASPAATDARKACTTAMNADPQFAADIIATQHDRDTIKVHDDANYHVQKNERHVFYAYAAMWIVAAAFVIFLWRRQQMLKAEIANLRRDLEAAADDPAAKGRA